MQVWICERKSMKTVKSSKREKNWKTQQQLRSVDSNGNKLLTAPCTTLREHQIGEKKSLREKSILLALMWIVNDCLFAQINKSCEIIEIENVRVWSIELCVGRIIVIFRFD